MEKKLKINRTDIFLILISIVLAGASTVAIDNIDNKLGLYSLVGFLGVIGALAIFIKPTLGANILIIAVFSNISDLLTDRGYPGINKGLVAMVAIVIAARYIYVEKKKLIKSNTTRFELFLFLLFAVSTASFFMAADKTRAVTAIFDMGKDIVIIYCIFFAIRSVDAWKKSIWVVILVTFGLSLMGMYQLITQNYSQDFFGLASVSMQQVFSDAYTPRLGGPIYAPNLWGQVVVAVVALVFFRIIHEQRTLVKLFCVIILGVLLLETLNTYSRGAYLALGAVVVMVLFFFEYRINPMITISGLLLLMIAIPLIPSSYLERFSTLMALNPSNQYSFYQDTSIRGRTSEMLTGLRMFESSPLLGVGVGNYKNNYQKYAQEIGIELRATEREPHSLYVQLLAESGILGFAAFIGAMIALFSGLARAKRSIKHLPDLKQNWAPWISSLQASLSAYLVTSFFLHGAYIRYFWILAGLAMTAIRLTSEMVKEREQAVLVEANL